MSAKKYFVPIVTLLILIFSDKVYGSVLDPAGTVGEKQLDLIKWSFILMLGVFAVVISLFIYILFKFREKPGQQGIPLQVHGSVKLEIIWTVIPFILLAFLAYPSLKTTFFLDSPEDSKNAIVIKVTGHQYWWEFEYPDLGIKTAQELHIPIGKTIEFQVRGRDVLHSFWIPALGGKIDVVPGRINNLWLDAKRVGEYQGRCAELCGAGHALMDFKVVAETETNYAKWVSNMQAPTVTTSNVKPGEDLFKQNCMGCHAGSDPQIKGPDLTKFGTRDTVAGMVVNNTENIKKWLKDPPKIKVGTKMPKFDYLNETEIDALTKYLQSRK